MIAFVLLAYLENTSLNTEPKIDQHNVNTKPMNARSMAKKKSIGSWVA